jgi:hypothetical protein
MAFAFLHVDEVIDEWHGHAGPDSKLIGPFPGGLEVIGEVHTFNF